MSNEVIVKGAERDDPGPKGVIIRFVEAAAAKDETALLACLTENSREDFGVEQTALESGTVTVGEIITEGDVFVVPTTTVDADGSEEMPFVVREEGGELRLDMKATVAKAMGFSPDELMDQMGEAMTEGMETMAEGMAEVLSEGLEAMGEGIAKALGDGGEAIEEGPDEVAKIEEEAAGEVTEEKEGDQPPFRQGQWVLTQEALVDFPDQILQAAYAVGSFLTPPFSPPMQEVDSEQYGTEESQVKTTQYGDAKHGFTVSETLTTGEGFSSHSVTVNAFGISEGQGISVVWAEYASGDVPSSKSVTINASASDDSLRAIEGFLVEDLGVEG